MSGNWHKVVLYLSGAVHPHLKDVAGIGYMLTPDMGNRVDLTGIAWGADTGCYAQGARFKLDRYLAWLEGMREYQASCLFATAPDVVTDAVATWERSREVLPLIRQLGYPAALVGQDGLECLPIEWDSFDAYFIGGSTAWKLSEASYAIAHEAQRRGKHVHMGRVNSLRRMRAAEMSGIHSVDGTFVKFGGDRNAAELLSWMEAIRRQPLLAP